MSYLLPAPGRPWGDYVKRIIINTSVQMDPYGSKKMTYGGRQRFVSDISRIALAAGIQVLILQKSTVPFEAVDDSGAPVVGLKMGVNWRTDALLGFRTRRRMKAGDALLYASGEDAWPFFAANSKALQHGIWWDGPYSLGKRVYSQYRAYSQMKSIRSMLCVDTNFINWLRLFGRFGLEAAQRCVFIPNYADTAKIVLRSSESPKPPYKLLFVRRNEFKRGPHLFLEALRLLRERNFPFTATMCTDFNLDEVSAWLEAHGLREVVHIRTATFEEVNEIYPRHDLSVVPTIWAEGTSLSAIESLVAGVPVITTPVGGLANVVIPGFNGSIVNPDGKAIANAIESALRPEIWPLLHQGAAAMRGPLGTARWGEQVREWLLS